MCSVVYPSLGVGLSYKMAVHGSYWSRHSTYKVVHSKDACMRIPTHCFDKNMIYKNTGVEANHTHRIYLLLTPRTCVVTRTSYLWWGLTIT